MKITYIFHSCYMVETKTAVFVFDYYNGNMDAMPTDKPVYFFASHGHFDHCGKKMLRVAEKVENKTFIFTQDIKLKPPAEDKLLYVEENCSYELDGMKIHTFHSTDLGVAYLVECEEGTIYHAGDLNWWHWNGESDEFNEKMAEDYHSEVLKIAELNRKIDVAFLPLDQRLEDAYDWGIKYFMKHTDTKSVMPMHFFSENFDICEKASIENKEFQEYKSVFMKIEKLNQEFEL